MDCSPPGSSVHGDSPGQNPGVGCHFLLHCFHLGWHIIILFICKVRNWVLLTVSFVAFSAKKQTLPSTQNIFLGAFCGCKWGPPSFLESFEHPRSAWKFPRLHTWPSLINSFNFKAAHLTCTHLTRGCLFLQTAEPQVAKAACHYRRHKRHGWGRSPGEGQATHTSTLAWEILWTEEPGGLRSMG